MSSIKVCELYTQLLEHLRHDQIARVRECAKIIFTDQKPNLFEKGNEIDLIKTIASKMCQIEEGDDLEQRFSIFGECSAFLLRYDQDVDMEEICFWGKRVRQDQSGKGFLVFEAR